MAGFFTSLEVRVNVPSENPLLTYAHCSLAVTRLHFLRQHLTATWHCSLCAHPLRPLPLDCNRGLLLFPALSPGVGPGAGAQGASVQWVNECVHWPPSAWDVHSCSSNSGNRNWHFFRAFEITKYLLHLIWFEPYNCSEVDIDTSYFIIYYQWGFRQVN